MKNMFIGSVSKNPLPKGPVSGNDYIVIGTGDTMNEGDWLNLITGLQTGLDHINRVKLLPATMVDARALSIAATHLETAMLWVANARKDV